MNSVTLVLECVRELGNTSQNQAAINVSEASRLFGADGILDSMDLVMLTVDLERAVLEKTGKTVALATEKAMSRTVSPFRSVKLLAAYIDELLEE